MKSSINNRIGYRPTWAEIRLNNLVYNLGQVRKMLSPAVKIMPTVKADAYGHGLIPVAKKIVASGNAEYLGVASIDEGIILRREGVTLPILVLGMILKEHLRPLFEYDLTPTVCAQELAAALDRAAAIRGKKLNIHIKVDTGMARIGVRHEDAYTLISRICRYKHLRLEGVFTHFAFADMNREFTLSQIGLFNQLIRRLEHGGMRIPLVHAANSMGTIGYKSGHFNMVRPGLVIYGLYPGKGLDIRLKPVLSLKTRVVYAKRVPAGQGLSYGHTYVTRRPANIVTLPIGYGDGYPRNLSNIAPVLLKGRRFKVSGRICMDQILVDVGNLAVRAGEEAVLIGTQGKHKITAEELAELSGTIPYEIACGLGGRVPRVYIE